MSSGEPTHQPLILTCHPGPLLLSWNSGWKRFACTWLVTCHWAHSWNNWSGASGRPTGGARAHCLPTLRFLTEPVGPASLIPTSGEHTLTRLLSRRWPRHGALSQGSGAQTHTPDPGPDLPSPLMQGAPSLSLPLAPKSPGCTHMVSHIALPYLPFCGGHPLTCLCMSWPGTLDPFHALPAAIRTLHLPAALPQLGWARRQL